MQDDTEFERLINTGIPDHPGESPDRVAQAINRAQRQVGVKDLLGLSLGRMWTTLALSLAPLFSSGANQPVEPVDPRQTKDSATFK